MSTLRKKILIVDDLKPYVERQKNILNRADFSIFTATSGMEAFNIHKKELVNLLITDLSMPGMDGDELVRMIRLTPELRGVSIIMVCSHRREDVDRCISCGANEHIFKPIDPDALFQKATMLLNVPARKAFRVLLKIKIEAKIANDSFFGTSHDISSSGLLFESEREISEGERISCGLHLPDLGALEIQGEIKRVIKSGVKKFKYGVRFLDMDYDVQQSLEKFVRKSAGFD